MRYKLLGQLRGAAGGASCPLDAPVPAGTGLEWAGPVRGLVEIVKSGDEYLARGRLQATVVLPCSRCTAVHEVPLDVELEERVALEQIDEPQAYQEAGADAGPIPVLNGELVDLSELVRQWLVLHTPARSLCRPDCRGLCPQCGAELNQGPCGCPSAEGDPRLAALREWL